MASYSSKRRRVRKVEGAILKSTESFIQEPQTDDHQLINEQSSDFNFVNNIVESASEFSYNCLDVSHGENENPEENCLASLPENSFLVPLSQKLVNWSIENNVTHHAVSSLLKILKPYVSEELPLSAKTLLKTKRQINIETVPGGKYYYFGIANSLKKILSKYQKSEFYFPIFQSNNRNLITLSISTDGIPLYKSTNLSMWPVLVRIDQLSVEPFLSALFSGDSKPRSIKEFLNPVIQELVVLQRDGILVDGILYYIKVSCIVADAPARSFVKGVKNHNAYHGCERCVDEGEWMNRVVFSTKPDRLRTDTDFKNMKDSDHHVNASPLLELNIGLVSQVVLDYMHLVCLGVVRKLLFLWTSGPVRNRLPGRLVNLVSNQLESCSKRFPSEFSRKPRSLKDLRRFKATELRTFLLFTGPVVLQNILDKAKYYHFILLHCAMKILLSKVAGDLAFNNLAKTFLSHFVSLGAKIYGNEFVVYNVHNLLHLADDAMNFGNLEHISAFPFESFMYSIKRLIRGGRLPLEQVVRRILENEEISPPLQSTSKTSFVKKPKNAVFANFFINCKKGNNCFRDSTGNVLLAKSFNFLSEDKIECILLDKAPVSYYPLDSTLISVYLVSLSGKTIFVKLENVVDKCLLLETNGEGNNHFICHYLNFDGS